VAMTKGGLMGKLVIGLAAFILLAAGGALAGNELTDSSQARTETHATLTGKPVIGLAAFILLAAGGALAGNALTDSSQGVTTTATTLGTNTNDDATTSTSTLETGEDLSGPCDEAEHANDPRCT